MTFDFGLTRVWNGWGVLIPLAVFVIVALVLDQVRPAVFDGASAFVWYGGFLVVGLWTLYYVTGQQQK